MAAATQNSSRSGERDMQGIGEDALRPMAAGLAIALQVYEDSMGDRLASLAKEQCALLAKLEAGRKSLPQPEGQHFGRDRGPAPHSNMSSIQQHPGIGRHNTETDDDVAYISHVMNQTPWYMQRVRALAAKQESLANRVGNLERRSAALRESLPVPMPEHMADEMARWRAGLKPFREQEKMAFVVCYRGGVAIRAEPNVDAPCVGEVLEWDEGFWAIERFGRLGEETIYVRLRDGRGWVFESLKGRKVLKRVAACMLPPPPAPERTSDGDMDD